MDNDKAGNPQHLEQKHADITGNPALEKSHSNDYNDEKHTVLNEFSPADHKRIKRKIDIRLVLTLGLMYCVSLMDRK